MTVCIFASSSSRIKPEYATAASCLGSLLARARIDVVYGGGGIGLMGKLADAVIENGGFKHLFVRLKFFERSDKKIC